MAKTRTTRKFTIDLDEVNEGIGQLFITDPSVLIRPAVPGQYPASVRHNSGHANGILAMGDDMGVYTTHIITSLSPEEAHKMLDRVFYAFIDACCFSLWCDARVSYIVDENIIRVEEYGFEDGEYTQRFNVHCDVPAEHTEGVLANLLDEKLECIDFVVIYSDDSEYGYEAQGFTG